MTLFLEETGGLLGAVTFVLFGAVMLVPVLDDLSGAVVLYAILSLTLVRMVPVALAMLGSDARPPSVAFLGWFGPRGLASIVFAVILVEDANLVHDVALSVLLHGLTATPLAARYAAWFAAHPRHAVPAFEAVPARHQRPHRWGRADHPSGDRRGHHRAGGLEAPRWPVVAGPSPARPSTTQWASRRSRSAERSGE